LASTPALIATRASILAALFWAAITGMLFDLLYRHARSPNSAIRVAKLERWQELYASVHGAPLTRFI
jgi:hypothetical protein